MHDWKYNCYFVLCFEVMMTMQYGSDPYVRQPRPAAGKHWDTIPMTVKPFAITLVFSGMATYGSSSLNCHLCVQ
jgi:hypothetical protein